MWQLLLYNGGRLLFYCELAGGTTGGKIATGLALRFLGTISVPVRFTGFVFGVFFKVCVHVFRETEHF